MSLDTRDKRASALGLYLPFGRLLPTPDGSLASSADRLHLAYGYRGLAPAAVVFDDTVGGGQIWTPYPRPTTWRPEPRGTTWKAEGR